jgi:Ras-related protein Rab-1A
VISYCCFQWDTAGQERFRSITMSFYRGANAICIVYDVTSQESFEHVEDWFSEAKRSYSNDTLKILVGNKADMFDERIISETQGKCLAEKLGCSFFETSAKSAQNVESIFMDVARQLIQKHQLRPNSSVNQIEIKQRVGDAGNQCCK